MKINITVTQDELAGMGVTAEQLRAKIASVIRNAERGPDGELIDYSKGWGNVRVDCEQVEPAPSRKKASSP